MEIKAIAFFVSVAMSGIVSFFSLIDQPAEIRSPLAEQKVLAENLSPTQIPTPESTSTPTVTPTLTPTKAPSPTPTPTSIILTSQELENLFTKYANEYSVDKEFLKRIAKCESNFNTNAQFKDYAGLFQFSTPAWVSARGLMGQNSDVSLRFNAEESIKTAAFKISRGELNAWPNCAK